jgi:hypothetical protein
MQCAAATRVQSLKTDSTRCGGRCRGWTLCTRAFDGATYEYSLRHANSAWITRLHSILRSVFAHQSLIPS